jgi:hypothetical protein
VHPWLKRLRHDVVKRAVWAARDLRSLEREPSASDVAALRGGLYDLRDDEGAATTARALWERMRSDAPRNTPEVELFSRSIEEAHAAVDALPAGFAAAVSALLRIEERFEALARSLDQDNE